MGGVLNNIEDTQVFNHCEVSIHSATILITPPLLTYGDRSFLNGTH